MHCIQSQQSILSAAHRSTATGQYPPLLHRRTIRPAHCMHSLGTRYEYRIPHVIAAEKRQLYLSSVSPHTMSQLAVGAAYSKAQWRMAVTASSLQRHTSLSIARLPVAVTPPPAHLTGDWARIPAPKRTSYCPWRPSVDSRIEWQHMFAPACSTAPTRREVIPRPRLCTLIRCHTLDC